MPPMMPQKRMAIIDLNMSLKLQKPSSTTVLPYQKASAKDANCVNVVKKMVMASLRERLS